MRAVKNSIGLLLAATLVSPVPAQTSTLFYRIDYPVNYSRLGEPGAIVIADFNHDGKLDFAMGGGLGIAVALGNGDGTFQTAMTFVPAGSGVDGTYRLSGAAADFDGDGNIDLVLYGRMIVILPGKGDGTFGPAHVTTSQLFSFPPNTSVELLADGDFNGDGRRDLAVVNEANQPTFQGSVIILLNNGDGSFTPHTGFNLPIPGGGALQEGAGIAVADFNRDGVPDLAVVTQIGIFGPPPPVLGHVFIALGKGDGSFSPPVAVSDLSSSITTFVLAADFNHDGAPDLATGMGTILMNNGDGSFRPAASVDFCCSNPQWMVAADWTGSGNPGLGGFKLLNDGITIMAGNGDGTFHSGGIAAVDLEAFGGGAFLGGAFASADLNGDGLPDLVVPSGGDTVSVFLNAGSSPPLNFVAQSAAGNITSIAPGSLATIYGNFPTTLGGITAQFKDSAGVTRPASLAYVSATQINLVVPAGTAPGVASVSIESGGTISAAGSALVRNVVPSIFTEQASTYPAAYAITVGPDGQVQQSVPVAACQTGPPPVCNAELIPRPAGSRVFLELFATGIRNHVAPVMVSLTGPAGPGFPTQINVEADYAGPQGQFEGLDQVNVEITNLPTTTPPQGAPPGTPYRLRLEVDGVVSTTVEFAVQ